MTLHHIFGAYFTSEAVQAMAAVLVTLPPIIAAIYAYANRHGINLWFGDRRGLIAQINSLLSQNNVLLRENAGLLRASNAWDAASRAETWSRADADALIAKVDRLQVRFHALVNFTRVILSRNIALKDALIAAAVPLPDGDLFADIEMPDVLREEFDHDYTA